MPVRLQAANILTCLGPAARPVLPAMKTALTTQFPKGDRRLDLQRYPVEVLSYVIEQLEAGR